jgi:hypothetical protein
MKQGPFVSGTLTRPVRKCLEFTIFRRGLLLTLQQQTTDSYETSNPIKPHKMGVLQPARQRCLHGHSPPGNGFDHIRLTGLVKGVAFNAGADEWFGGGESGDLHGGRRRSGRQR